MASKLKEIEKQALELPVGERAQLIEHLIRSLDEEEDPDAEQAWIAEARRRHEELQRGDVSGKPAEQVLKDRKPPVEDENSLKEEIQSYLKDKLAPYEIPKMIEFRKELPLTTVGKVDKKELRKQERGG